MCFENIAKLMGGKTTQEHANPRWYYPFRFQQSKP